MHLPQKIAAKTLGFLKQLLLLPVRIAVRTYVFIFGRASMQKANNLLLKLVLKACGYGNPDSLETSGETNFIRRLAKENPLLCIDVGANQGSYSLELLRKTKATVIAFEPQPDMFAKLTQLQKKFPRRLVAANKGLGDQETVLELHYGDADTGLASFSEAVHAIDTVRAANTKTMKVPVTTLDKFLFQDTPIPNIGRIDLLKIDTEGFEYNVLRGAQRTLDELKPRYIHIEFNWHHLFTDHSLYRFSMLLKDYDVYQILPHGGKMAKIDPRRPQSNIYEYSNFVFVRK